MTESDTEEDHLVVVEFPEFEEGIGALKSKGVDPSKALGPTLSHRIEISDLDTANPMCKIGPYEFSGIYEMGLGSRLYFSVKDKVTSYDGKEIREEHENVEKENYDSTFAEGRTVDFLGMGERKLVFRLVKINEIDGIHDEADFKKKTGKRATQSERISTNGEVPRKKRKEIETNNEGEGEEVANKKRGIGLLKGSTGARNSQNLDS